MAQEAVEIANPGPSCDLKGWRLHSSTGAEYVFPAFTLEAGGSVWVHSGGGVATSTDLYWGTPKAAWQKGEEILLLDNLGQIRFSGWVP